MRAEDREERNAAILAAQGIEHVLAAGVLIRLVGGVLEHGDVHDDVAGIKGVLELRAVQKVVELVAPAAPRGVKDGPARSCAVALP